MRKTLVFYKGRAPHGQKSDWIMHEYRLDEHHDYSNVYIGELVQCQEDGWVVCRVFKKKNYHKVLDYSPMIGTLSESDGLDQILQCMGRTCKRESSERKQDNMVMEKTNGNGYLNCLLPIDITNGSVHVHDDGDDKKSQSCKQQTADAIPHDWATLDRLVASHLNGQTDGFKQLTYFDDMMNFNEPQLTASRLIINNHNPLYYTTTSGTTGGLISCNDDDEDDENHNGDLDLWGTLTAGYCSQSGSDHLD